MGYIKYDDRLTVLPGVGEKRASELAALHVFTVGDLLCHFPRAYQNRGQITRLVDAAAVGERCAMLLTVGAEPTSAEIKRGMTIARFPAFDESGRITVQFFNNKFVKSIFRVGGIFRFYGKIEKFRGRFVLTSPEYEAVSPGKALPDYFAVYPLAKGLTQKLMQKLIASALEMLDPNLPEPICDDYRKRLGLCGRREALFAIHRPGSPQELEKARNYFIFEELYTFALGVLGEKKQRADRSAPVIACEKKTLDGFLSRLPFAPTGAQRRVIDEIAADMRSGRPMNRMVCGDVGCGKTVCAAAAAAFAVADGYQCAMMVPTEILARQHFDDLSEMFEGTGVRVSLLVGSLTPAKKKQVQKQIAAGETDLVIGTHALISDNVAFKKCGLVITDEQHRFGLAQREALAAGSGLDGMFAHVLAMSATPIPRSLALVLYGDMSLSAVDEMPPGRQKVSTFLVDESYRERMEGFVLKQAKEGRQTYIVCPSIDDDGEDEEDSDGGLVDIFGRPVGPVGGKKLRSAVGYAAELAAAHPGLAVGCLHGRMKASEKDRVMSDFAEGRLDVLVSTTVIEVGVNVPNATLMIVENAERFGLSGLHQLRGRVGRGKYKSWCILVSDDPGEEAKERLETLCKTNDGFAIAETDLKMRGPGDFIPAELGGRRQSGQLRFRLASLCDNTDMLLAAFSLAGEAVEGSSCSENIFHTM